ncbi:MAG: hypothetical protein JXM73_22560 [Anaerolineae bacterium]|nr:hypothetical protein [Anaerolineae bacterium]
MSGKRLLLVVLAVGALALAAGIGSGRGATVQALPPLAGGGGEVGTIPYTAKLADPSGQPVADGAYDFRFSLYAAEIGGEMLWSEAQPGVQVWDGDLALRLGRMNPISEATLGTADLWLSVAVRGPGEADYTPLTPRQRVSAVAPASPSGATAGGACPHNHFGEEWIGTDDDFGLRVLNTGSGVGIHGYSDNDDGLWGETQDVDSAGVVGTNSQGVGVYGRSSVSGKGGVFGENTGAGYGVYGRSANGIAVLGHSTTGAGVRGEASSISQAGVYGWNGGTGPGVVGYSSGGAALSAVGTGRIYSSADLVLYLSPHDLVAREEDQGLLGLTPLDNGGVRIRNLSGSGARYASMPVSTFGSLFGSMLYVKSLEVCYKAPAAWTFISATGVYKNNGSDVGWETYLQDPTSHSSTTYTCYPVSASPPRLPIDNSTWVQFNMSFGGSGSGADIYIYTVKLTLSENQN